MAMNTATVVTTYKNEAGTVTVKSETVEGDLTQNIERTIDAGVTNAEFVISFAAANIIAFGMGCSKTKGEGSDKTTGLTVKTNSSSTPDDTFSLTPSNGIGWSSGDAAANPFTEDVTKIYVTNDGTAKQDFFLRMLLDSTPGLVG